ncbi:MAG: IS1634 family transposase, partial [Petrimonas sp.]
MFIREKKNRSGSVSIQIISKVRGKYKLVKTVGCATERHKINELKLQAKQQLEELKRQPPLFASADDQLIEQAFSSLSNSHIRTVGPELIFGKIYDHIGFGVIKEPLFRHLVVARLAFPLSKLKTSEYLYRYQGIWIDTDKIYR